MEQKTFTITCYGKTKRYNESKREKMKMEYLIAMSACDGSESERYANIYFDLANGAKSCKDY